MTTIDGVIRDLLNYFAAIGANPQRTFGIRELNSQVMMNAYAPKDRECLALALARLEQAGLLEPVSTTDYRLTEKGFGEVRALRQARADCRGGKSRSHSYFKAA